MILHQTADESNFLIYAAISFSSVYTNIFKVDCEASYPNLYKSLSAAHSRWNPSTGNFLE